MKEIPKKKTVQKEGKKLTGALIEQERKALSVDVGKPSKENVCSKVKQKDKTGEWK